MRPTATSRRATPVTVEPFFLDRAGTAAYLAISERLLTDLVHAGKLTPVYTGALKRKPLFRLADLKAYAESLGEK